MTYFVSGGTYNLNSVNTVSVSFFYHFTLSVHMPFRLYHVACCGVKFSDKEWTVAGYEDSKMSNAVETIKKAK